jgi:hypothetical protein
LYIGSLVEKKSPLKGLLRMFLLAQCIGLLGVLEW